ncbi:hypothetical protein LC612_43030 [Nostoc sp. CHAB 5834]|nr:hypothetical protein [Nostoc sp. CHAB 5834]
MANKPEVPFSFKSAMSKAGEALRQQFDILVEHNPEAVSAVKVFLRPKGRPQKVEYPFRDWRQAEGFLMDLLTSSVTRR